MIHSMKMLIDLFKRFFKHKKTPTVPILYGFFMFIHLHQIHIHLHYLQFPLHH